MRLVTPLTAYFPAVFTRRTCNEHPCTVPGDHQHVVNFTRIGPNCTVWGEGSPQFSPCNIPGRNVTHAITSKLWDLIPCACSIGKLGVNMQLSKMPHMSPSAPASITQCSAQSGSPTTAATNPMHPRLVQTLQGTQWASQLGRENHNRLATKSKVLVCSVEPPSVEFHVC